MDDLFYAYDAFECVDGLTGETAIVSDLDEAADMLRGWNEGALDARVVDDDPDSPTIAELIEEACDLGRANCAASQDYLHERVRPVVLDRDGYIDEEATARADRETWA